MVFMLTNLPHLNGRRGLNKFANGLSSGLALALLEPFQ